MNRTIQIAKALALLGVAFACFTVGFAALDLNVALVENGRRMAAVLDDAKTTLEQARKLIASSRDSVEEARRLERDQRRLLNITTGRTARLIQSTDQQLNGPGGVLPSLAAAVQKNSAGVGRLVDNAGDAVTKLSAGADPVLLEARDALHQVGELAADPNIKRTFKETADSMANVDKGTAEAAALLYDLRHPEKPGRYIRALSILLGLLRAGGQTAPLFK
jgi:uncharacterized protein YoxC